VLFPRWLLQLLLQLPKLLLLLLSLLLHLLLLLLLLLLHRWARPGVEVRGATTAATASAVLDTDAYKA